MDGEIVEVAVGGEPALADVVAAEEPGATRVTLLVDDEVEGEIAAIAGEGAEFEGAVLFEFEGGEGVEEGLEGGVHGGIVPSV